MLLFQYVVLHILFVLTLVFFCWRIDEVDRKYYWSYAIVPIILFTLVEGLRCGRGIDWCGYSYVYQDLALGKDTGHEPLFTLVWGFFSSMGVPYWGVISFCSFLYIYSIFFLIKPYRNVCKIAVPLVVLVGAIVAENLIRWYMGLSLLFISIRVFLQGKKSIAFLIAFFSVLIHYGLFLFLPFLFLLNCKTPLISPVKMTVGVFVLSVVFSPEVLSVFAFVFDYLLLFSDRFYHYTTDPVGWLTGEGQNASLEKKGFVYFVVSMFQYFIFMFEIYKKLRIRRWLIPVYNLSLVAMLFLTVSSGLELLSRYSRLFEPFLLILGAYVVRDLVREARTSRNVALLFFCLFFVVRKVVYFCNPFIYPSESLLAFVWNDTQSPIMMMRCYW